MSVVMRLINASFMGDSGDHVINFALGSGFAYDPAMYEFKLVQSDFSLCENVVDFRAFLFTNLFRLGAAYRNDGPRAAAALLSDLIFGNFSILSSIEKIGI